MKSFSKRVASFAMAAAMVLSVAAVSPVDAEAATAKITKKSSITAGKTYTYNVKNVTKSQYIKVRMSSGVTVKYNNKTVKKNSTKINGGKTIALKVKAADKVGNYKATLKAVIYNKKNNKKVKTLTTQSTVKCTTLKVTGVQTASTTGKYLVATFNKSLDSLNPADIEIRNLNTNELKGVEEVKLASDGKSATITLVGNENSWTGTQIANDFVEANVDYSFTVTKNGATASTRFTVDAVMAYVTVVNYDADIRELTVTPALAKNANTNSHPVRVKIPETVNSDNFQTLLGRTVSIWYNKNDVATKLVKNEETVVEGAFEFISRDTAAHYLKDKVTGKQYYISESIGALSDVHNTIRIVPNAANKYTNNFTVDTNGDGVVDNATVLPYADKADIDYAKIVLYSNGKVRTMVAEDQYDTNKLYVTKVDADKNMVYCGDNNSVNLKGFTIVDHDKLVSIKDIKVGDMVFVNSADKFAEVYTSTKDGKVEAAYDDEFKFDGTLYSNNEVWLLPDSGKAKAPSKMTYKEGSAFIAAGGTATIYLDHANKPVFIKGEQKYSAAGSSATLLATSNVIKYTLATKQYVQFKGFDGASNSAYDICLDNLQTVTVNGVKYTAKASAATGSDSTPNPLKPNEKETHNFVFTGVDNAASNITTEAGTPLVNSVITNTMIELSKDAAGNVTGITVKNMFQPADAFVGGKTYVKATGTNQSYQITAGTAVYAWDGVNVSTAKKVNYSDYSATTVSGNTFVYTGSTAAPYEVSYVLVNNETVAPANYKEAVVTAIWKADGKASKIQIAYGTETKDYELFRDDAVKKALNGVNAGDYIRLGIANDDKTVVEATLVGVKNNIDMTRVYMQTNTADRVNVTEGKFKAHPTMNTAIGNEYKLAAKCTIVARDKNYEYTSRYKVATLADLAALNNTDEIYIHYANADAGAVHAGLVDAIVIEY